MVNWNTIKFRASSFGNLLAESRDKKEPIGKTAQKELIKIYVQEAFDRKKEIVTKQMQKGIMAEPDSILLLSILDGQLYEKNTEKFTNEFFSGTPDILVSDDTGTLKAVLDVKTSWEFDSFMPKLTEPLDNGYEAQLNVYFDLLNVNEGEICYCLVNCPESLLNDERKKLLYAMDVISEESPAYKEAVKTLEKNMMFDDVPPELRVIRQKVTRNQELIDKMKAKVPLFRQWLEDFEKKHLSQYKKELV